MTVFSHKESTKQKYEMVHFFSNINVYFIRSIFGIMDQRNWRKKEIIVTLQRPVASLFGSTSTSRLLFIFIVAFKPQHPELQV